MRPPTPTDLSHGSPKRVLSARTLVADAPWKRKACVGRTLALWWPECQHCHLMHGFNFTNTLGTSLEFRYPG